MCNLYFRNYLFVEAFEKVFLVRQVNLLTDLDLHGEISDVKHLRSQHLLAVGHLLPVNNHILAMKLYFSSLSRCISNMNLVAVDHLYQLLVYQSITYIKVSHKNYYQSNNTTSMLKKQAKVVQINLLSETKKYHTSKKTAENKKEIIEEKQFSFSNDKANYSPVHTQLPPSKANQSKKATPTSPPKLKPHVNGIKKGESSKDKINQIRKKVAEYNENYEAMNERDQLFKKSMGNLKNTMFNDSRDSKGLTIKTLKEIGKYASNKSKQKEISKYSPSTNKHTKPKKDIPVQFYGFDLSEKNRKEDNYAGENRSHTISYKQKKDNGLSVQQLLKGTYSSFQQRYYEELDHIQQPPKPINWQQTNQHIPQQISEFHPQTFEEVSSFDDEKAIEENQIDVICQIFELCEKYEEGDRIVLKDLQRLMQQFERMFFIKIIQQSKANGKIGRPSESSEERQFYEVLKQFERALKIIFYRREANNVYDALYYLKESHKLKSVTTNFLKIKSILPL